MSDKLEHQPQPAKNKLSSKSNVWVVALLLVLLIASAGYFQYRLEQQISQQSALEQQFASLGNQLSQQNSQLNQQKQNSSERKERINSIEGQLAYMREAIDQVPGARLHDWKLAEVEYLLRLASQRVQLQQEPFAARALFQSADSILADLNDPALLVVREQIAEAMFNLGKQSELDTTGLYAKLQALKSQIGDVVHPPQNFKQVASEEATSSSNNTESTDTQNSLFEKLYNLVQIRHRDQVFEAPLAQQQRQLLAHSMRLMLEQTQWALIKRDNTLYQASLENAIQWIDENLRHQNALLVLNELQQLKNYDVTLTLPDVSKPLTVLRQIIKNRTYLPVPDKANSEENSETKSKSSATPQSNDNKSNAPEVKQEQA